MSHDAIPTVYCGVQFRSRLEARWACMFDHLGWTWHYEPIDLEGYIPDFIVQQGGTDILVEIKPFIRVLDPVVAVAAKRITETTWGFQPAVILGSVLSRTISGCAHVGAFTTEWDPAPFPPLGGEPAFAHTTVDPTAEISRCDCNRFRLNRDAGQWNCYHCGDNKGRNNSFKEIKTWWLAAGNAVQWRSPARC